MFDHVTLRVADRAASEAFYTTLLAPLGIAPTHRDDDLVEWDDFGLAQADADHPPTTGLHLGFVAPGREEVAAAWRAAVDAGHPDLGAPGPRPQYREDYVGGFVRDPDGNSAEAVHHGALRRGGVVDHLWIRVPDLAASRAFYAAVAPHAGLRVGPDRPGRTPVLGESGSFSLVAGTPHTQNLHLALPARDLAQVEAFHRAALAAGGRDNGPPGERPQYHPGYVSAYALAPDGANVEVVVHHRG